MRNMIYASNFTRKGKLNSRPYLKLICYSVNTRVSVLTMCFLEFIWGKNLCCKWKELNLSFKNLYLYCYNELLLTPSTNTWSIFLLGDPDRLQPPKIQRSVILYTCSSISKEHAAFIFRVSGVTAQIPEHRCSFFAVLAFPMCQTARPQIPRFRYISHSPLWKLNISYKLIVAQNTKQKGVRGHRKYYSFPAYLKMISIWDRMLGWLEENELTRMKKEAIVA
jgi:hypothetical protein